MFVDVEWMFLSKYLVFIISLERRKIENDQKHNQVTG
jgi:hypothetical protein